jgi:tripartite-type tricarboxylate transporter receptor subunit TctC
MVYPATGQLLSQVKDGKLRPLAAASPARLPALPNTPTFDEVGIPNFNASGWFSVVVPSGTPRDIVDRLNRDIGRIINGPELATTYTQLSMIPGGGPPEVLAQRIKLDLAQWAPVVKSLNISQNY